MTRRKRNGDARPRAVVDGVRRSDTVWPDVDGEPACVDWPALLDFDMASINGRKVVRPTCGREERS